MLDNSSFSFLNLFLYDEKRKKVVSCETKRQETHELTKIESTFAQLLRFSSHGRRSEEKLAAAHAHSL